MLSSCLLGLEHIASRPRNAWHQQLEVAISTLNYLSQSIQALLPSPSKELVTPYDGIVSDGGTEMIYSEGTTVFSHSL